MTESEVKFEQYLSGQNLAWTRLPESTRKQADYAVKHRGANCIFEVKEFDGPETKPTGGYSPLPPIRDRINRAREKFADYRDCCCGVVLWGSKSIYRTAHQSVVFPAAFGEGVYAEPEDSIDAGAEAQSFRFIGKAALTPKQNTTISGIVILAKYRLNHVWVDAGRQMVAKRQRGEEIRPGEQFDLCQQIYKEKGLQFSYEGTIRTIVLENPYARTPFPSDLFVGSFDQHWRLQSGWFRLAFIGSEIERLKFDKVPSLFW